MDYLDKINSTIDDFIAIRHKIHAHPELGFEEVNTSQLVANLLKKWGYTVDVGMAKTGVVGILKRGTSNKTIGLRADIDALPIIEDTNTPYQSTIQGKFHGCGHDGHTASLLCAAHYLAHYGNFDGTVRVIFQPAEELLYGGRVMIDDGLFDKYPCDAIFGLHNMPRMNAGEFYFKSGPAMASSDTLHIHIKGVGSHAAMPESGIDATLVACHIATALQSVVSRTLSPFDNAVVTIGAILSGNAPNIINDTALMKLSVRTLDKGVREKTLKRINEIATYQAISFGATASIEAVNSCPVLINDDTQTQFAKTVASKIFGDTCVHDTTAFMGSEDFAFMLDANPNGCYAFIGNGGSDKAPMLHNPKYDFNDKIIAYAAAYWCGLAESFLG